MIDISDGSKQPSQQPEREPSPVPVVSDIPLIVSDIPQVVNNIPVGVTAPPPQTQTQLSKLIEKGAQKPTKRKASPKWVGFHRGCFKEDMCQPLHNQHMTNLCSVLYSRWRKEGEAKSETSHALTAFAAWPMTPVGLVMKQLVWLRLSLATSSSTVIKFHTDSFLL